MAKAKKSQLEVKGRIWIESGDHAFLGRGRVQLLEKIKEAGSLQKAAKELKMSYRYAWHLVQSMNDASKNPLVELKTGGKGGGGATVTQEGEAAIKKFVNMHKLFLKFLEKESKKLQIK